MVGCLWPRRYAVRVSAYAEEYGYYATPSPAELAPAVRAPDPPAAQAAATFNGTAVVLFWTPPRFNGGAAVASYSVDWAAADGSAAGTVGGIAASERSWVVPNMLRGVYVRVNVSACNLVAGCGPPAPETMALPMQPPSQVRGLSARCHNASAAQVAFDPPLNDGGDAVFKYLLEIARVPFSEDGWAVNPSDNHEGPEDDSLQEWQLAAMFEGGPQSDPTYLSRRPSGASPFPEFALLGDDRVQGHYGRQVSAHLTRH